ncbi:MAG: histidinol-phosphate aminotransferase family protein, partial [Candidatus Eremiobacteraeota bacterium]|nr:histidinol-phosphate aminotransferase family protein [Candidatus Eremiobacteraeota bacterium]
PDAIVIANGAAALFGIALHALEVERCVVPMPAFSEHRHALATAGAIHSGVPLDPTREFALQPERIVAAIRASDADACLVTNPHNPSGALTPRESMLQLAHDAKSLGTVTIVDEAFIDYAPEASVTRDAAARDALVTIRSLTKFFAVPALRVGYAVCDPSLARIMRRAIPSWPVTTLASRAVAVALDDAEFTSRTLVANERERARLAARLAAIGLRANPSATNFLLVSLPEDAPRAPELTQRLVLQSQIVVRDCSSFEGLEAGDYIRVAVRAAAENERLVDALARALGRC